MTTQNIASSQYHHRPACSPWSPFPLHVIADLSEGKNAVVAAIAFVSAADGCNLVGALRHQNSPMRSSVYADSPTPFQDYDYS